MDGISGLNAQYGPPAFAAARMDTEVAVATARQSLNTAKEVGQAMVELIEMAGAVGQQVDLRA